MKNKHIFNSLLTLLFVALTNSFQIVDAQEPVGVTEVDENIPTYLSGAPEPNPMFFFGNGSQGAEQRIYPYPLYDNLTNKKGNKIYHLVYLENEYIKIGVAPELGGKLFSAVDKTNNYDFIYRQHVIKPALIGLTGAWISGGLEWNIPHHHRASTLSPVQYKIAEHSDGSKTIWVGELEVRHRMRWAVGYTLRPGSSIIECNVRINNRTPLENTMLCFANIAVSVDENYQVIFPPRTQWSTGHHKRRFNPWPVVDSVDVSWYKNNSRPASWFAVNYEDDFVAGYDHGKNAGIMSVADHNIVAGKKFFTWGVGNMWDNILTDDDGPYLEIMVGAYSDNQPDYSWLQPNEERSFNISLFPFRGIKGVKNSNLDAAVNLEVEGNQVEYGFYTTKAYPLATMTLKAGSKVITEEKVAINPGKPYTNRLAMPAGLQENELRASISVDGRELVAYSPIVAEPIPEPVGYTRPESPEDIANNEELFLTGQRIYQFHHPSLDADPYWEEVLRRDPGDVAANTGMGILNLKKAKYAVAEGYFSKAIERLTAQYTTPKNVEPMYYLGEALKGQGRLDEAYTAFYKATWKQEWKSPAYFSLAEIACIQGKYALALEHVNHAIDANAYNTRAYNLKAGLLRHLNRIEEASVVIAFARKKCDPLDAQLMAEQWLVSNDTEISEVLFTTLQDHPVNAEEVAAGYLRCGFWEDGETVLSKLTEKAANKTKISPMVYYYLGYFAEKQGNSTKANNYRRQAVLQSLDYVFPFQYEAIDVLRSAIKANPNDARAPYYLGNLLYDWQPEEATALWEKSTELDPNAPITWRNLAIAYSHRDDKDAKRKAIGCFEKAVNLPNPYPTHFAELDQLYKSEGVSVEKRLAVLEKNEETVMKKDEAIGALVNLKIFAGKVNEAISILNNRVFSIWEGGSAFNTGDAWANAYLIRGINNFQSKNYREALNDFQNALKPPENLRAERGITHTAQIKYQMGCAYEALGNESQAKQTWTEVIEEETRRRWRRSYDKSQAENYFKALARKKLFPNTNVEDVFVELAENQDKKESDEKDDLAYQFVRNRQNTLEYKAYPHYLSGLGYLGLGKKAKARKEFNAALEISPDYLEAKIALNSF